MYTEEIIDHRMVCSRTTSHGLNAPQLKCVRVANPALGTVDFVEPDGTVVLRTCAAEAGRVVLQMGTADPDRAVRWQQSGTPPITLTQHTGQRCLLPTILLASM